MNQIVARCFFIFGVLIGWVSQSWALSITSPTEGTTFRPGDTVTIIAQFAPGESIHTVDFNTTTSTFNFVEGPPFQFQFTIPLEFIGTLTLYAKGISGVRPNLSFIEATPINIQITLPPDVTLQSLIVDPRPRFLYLDPEIGRTEILGVGGLYSDGVRRSIKGLSSGTTYDSSNEKIVTVDSNGVLHAIGAGSAVITIRNTGKTAQIKVRVDQNSN